MLEYMVYFTPIFFSENFLYTFLKFPELDTGFPYLLMDGWGLSIFVSTPFLLLLVFIKWRDKISLTLLGSAIAINLPSLFYYNTGYRQSSNRFLLDYLPILLLIILIALEGKDSRLGKILAYLSITMGFVALINFYVG